jgi:hypothetical protein
MAIVVLVDLFKSIPEVVEKDLAAAETCCLKQRASTRESVDKRKLVALTRYCSSFLNSSRPINPSPAAHRHHVHDIALYKDNIHYFVRQHVLCARQWSPENIALTLAHQMCQQPCMHARWLACCRNSDGSEQAPCSVSTPRHARRLT